MSMNVNLPAGRGVDLFRLRTAANGPIIKAFVATNGTLQIRSDFGSTTRTTTHGYGYRLAQRRALRHRRVGHRLEPLPRRHADRDQLGREHGHDPRGPDPDR